MNVLITGANRGIGLGLVQHYLNEGHHVWACCRQPECADALHRLQQPTLSLLRWDVADETEPTPYADAELPQSIDLLINNAGIYGPGKDGQSLHHISAAAMMEVFNVDAIGPLRVVQNLLPRLQHGSAVIANVSSKMGSVTDNSSGGTYAYRAAKSALTMISKSMAVDLAGDGIHVITLHPGWVQTEMTGHSGLVNVQTCVNGMTKVIATAREYPAGSLVAYDGQVVPY